ncbi:TIR domain-containing protein [Acinetobacter baumannii]|nr:TIR domain-containing protein [Acinetobacter baumannii]MDC5310223.1 TIR domain-containing protein [Acinetobacter baumannii]MDC5452984.1 TIR domain-containing protein [Acinetobacter baumannii]MDC5610584.1 TIR domain-containing protein [Acinetobacter baumannii]MDC5622756.1 TIR domain-containing protein [Acinetobacter baumannii]
MARKNIFISHVHEDDDGLKKTKDLIKTKGFEVRDFSINSSKPNSAKAEDYIKYQILAPRIKQCSTLMVYITPKTKNSYWVNWEIEYAQKLGLRIVGVWAHGQQGCEVPEELENYADAIVGWNSECLINAINGESTFEGYSSPIVARYLCG